ncbi:hypothetical protein D3C76_1686510 [compost metagenome]
MQEPRLIAKHTHPGAHRLEGEQAGGGVDDAVVRSRRNQDAHIHTAQYRQAQGSEHGLVGDEVGAGDPQPFARRVYGLDEEQ